MRAMRQTLALCALLLAAGCGDDTNAGPDMSAPLDMTAGPDMAMRVPDGVSCGTMNCAIGQSCCVQPSGMTATQMCIAPNGACPGGGVLACDGPEDCSTGNPYCCATVKFTQGGPDAGAGNVTGGDSMCTMTCDASFTPGSLKTRLCKVDSDCTGLNILGQVNLDKCCSTTMAPGKHFCAAPFMGITCP
jgi:hypothetical protein